VQGDDGFYLSMAQHALIDPLHPNHFRLIAQGSEVDMRGFPKPPGNAWVLAAMLAALGDFREAPFHLLYAGFSLLALWAMWELALVFCSCPKWAVAIFAAVPAFVINGNSLEADIPFLAFFMASIAFLVRGANGLAAISGCLAALIEYKALALVPIGAVYVWRERRQSRQAWLALLAPALTFVGWQAFERLTTGAASAEVLTGYFQTRELQSAANKLRNAVALTVHAGWIVPPLLAGATFGRVDWAVATAAAAGLRLCADRVLLGLGTVPVAGLRAAGDLDGEPPARAASSAERRVCTASGSLARAQPCQLRAMEGIPRRRSTSGGFARHAALLGWR
jgi:hypothetical protein